MRLFGGALSIAVENKHDILGFVGRGVLARPTCPTLPVGARGGSTRAVALPTAPMVDWTLRFRRSGRAIFTPVMPVRGAVGGARRARRQTPCSHSPSGRGDIEQYSWLGKQTPERGTQGRVDAQWEMQPPVSMQAGDWRWFRKRRELRCGTVMIALAKLVE